MFCGAVLYNSLGTHYSDQSAKGLMDILIQYVAL